MSRLLRTGEWVEFRKGENTIMENCKENDSYLVPTDCIDYNHPLVQEKVIELREKAGSSLDYIKKAYESFSLQFSIVVFSPFLNSTHSPVLKRRLIYNNKYIRRVNSKTIL